MVIFSRENAAKYRVLISFLSAFIVFLLVVAVIIIRKPVQDQPAGEIISAHGKYMDWQEVGKIFPKYSNAVVVDMDTGLKFNIQRRGGTYHADVQPLTAGDTVIMKRIYGGQWSWKRRAVLVHVGGVEVAGSMNGMPHGGGNIKDNDFIGHFCIHFKGSRLHINGREDPAHRMMVLKAAGLMENTIAKSSADEVLRIFFTALDQGELNILARTTFFNSPEDFLSLFRRAGEIKKAGIKQVSGGENSVFKVTLNLEFGNGVTIRRKDKDVRMSYREDVGWRVDYSSVDALLSPDKGPDEIVTSPALAEDQEEDL